MKKIILVLIIILELMSSGCVDANVISNTTNHKLDTLNPMQEESTDTNIDAPENIPNTTEITKNNSAVSEKSGSSSVTIPLKKPPFIDD